MKTKISVILATMFGLGNVPVLGGTVGSIVGVFVYLLIPDQLVFFLFAMAAMIVAFMVCTTAERFFQQKDCKRIIIDDFSGQLIALIGVPHELKYILASFFLFRMFDSLKIYPANKIEQYDGSLGIVGDDVIAGIYAFIVLRLAMMFV